MAESYSVTAILSAKDKNFSSVFGSAHGVADSLSKKLAGGLGFGVLTGVGQKAFSMLTSSASGFVSELESTSAAWKTFEQNAAMSGHTADEINSTKKALQDFATQTIYSASDMSTTFAQLDAVGIESAESLVKGFGGIAAAAENPAQAMKTLSQQGVQMAAKPTVAWQDFKLMLEQTPAGIAAVAKEMGMTTAEMVQAVQDGEISTKDFFAAVEKVGTSDAFTKMATQYKTVDQAAGGLEETITNKLMPTFELFQKYGISAVEGIIEKLDGIDGDAIAGEVKSVIDAFSEGGLSGALEKVGGYVDKLPDGLKAAAAAVGAFAGVGVVNSFLDSGIWKAGVAGISTFKDAASLLPGALSKDLAPVAKGFAEAGNSALNFASKHCPQALTAMSEMGDDAKALAGALKTNTIDKFTSRFPKLTTAVKKAGSGIVGVTGKMGSALTKTMGVALKAIMPAAAIGAVLAGLGLLYSKFGDQIDGILQLAREKGPQFITNLVSGITSRLPDLIASGAQLVSGLLSTITANIPAVIAGGVSIITTLVAGVASAAPELIGKATELIGTFAVSIVSALPQLITAGMNLLASLAQGVGQNLPMLVQYAMQAVLTFAQGIIGNLPQILASAVQIVNSLVSGIVSSIPVLIQQGIQLITYLAQSFIQNLPTIIQTGIQVIAALVTGLIQAVPLIVQGAIEMVKSLIDTVLNTDWIQVGSDIISAIGNGIKAGFGGLGDLVTGLFSGDTSAEDGAAQQATRAAESTAQAYISSSGYVSEAAAQVGSEASSSLISSLSVGTEEVSSVMNTMGTSGAEAFSTAFSGIDMSGIGTEMSGTISTEFESGLAQLPAGVDSVGSNVINAFDRFGAQSATSVRTTANAVVLEFTSGIKPAAEAGQKTGEGYSTKMKATASAARSAGAALKTAGLNGMSGGYSTAYSHGANIGQGLVNGMRSKIGAAWAAAESLAAAADKAIHARAQIGSPSRITTRFGEWIALGLPKGMDEENKAVARQAAELGQTVIDSIEKKVQAARAAMTDLMTVDSPGEMMSRRAENLSLSDEYEYKSEAQYYITVESVLDGRKVGEGVATYVGKAIDKEAERNARKRGKIA